MWQIGLIPASLVAYLLLVWLVPSHLHAVWLGVGVVMAARAWEVRGGVLMALVSGVALFLGLWQIHGSSLLEEPLLMSGYGWAGIGALALGYYVGSLTRQARRMARINADLRQAQQQLGALHQIALSLSTTLDSQRLMEMILEQLGKLWGYDYGAILLVDEKSGELIVAAAHGYEVSLGLRLKPGEGISGTVVKTGLPVCVGDVTEDPRYVGGVPGARSELAIPLAWEGKILGVLNVESKERNAYTAADVALLTTVAEQAASYLANARLHQHTRQLAITDPHTGLFNYRHYMDQVVSLVNQAQLTGSSFSLLMIDLDHFKRVNDTYGHPTGDVVLEQAARLIRLSCRQVDLVFRYGGEEFSVILPETDSHVAARVAERIRERIHSHTFVTKQGRPVDFTLSCSIGVASYPQDGLSQVDLLLSADRALYSAKRTGRNRVVLHNQEAEPDVPEPEA
ncbi:MAG: diguanylate cyclase [Bacillota bacterium]